MIRTFLCAVAFSAAALSASAATITNGDFETGDLSGWSVGSTANGETAYSGVDAFDTGGNGASDAASFRIGQIDFDPGVNEGITLSQTISIMSAGTYSFAAEVAVFGGRFTNLSGGIFELIVGGNVLDVFDAARVNSRSTERDLLEGEVALAVGDVDLTIRIMRPFIQTSDTPLQYVDNVTISPVPLPAGLPLLAFGLGSLALVRRKS